MRSALLLVLLAVSLPVAAGHVPDPVVSRRDLFARTLVLGASVSAGAYAVGPGSRIARDLGTESGLIGRARSGAPSQVSLLAVTEADLSAATVIIAVDLFFWDARGNPAEAAAKVNGFFDRVGPLGKTLVIGNVPRIRRIGLADLPARPVINAAIAARCAAMSTCRLLDLDRLYEDTAAGRRLPPLDVLTVDRLHLSDAGSAQVAAEILALLEAR